MGVVKLGLNPGVNDFRCFASLMISSFFWIEGSLNWGGKLSEKRGPL